MNLTAKLKAKIIREFKLGREMSEFSGRYDVDILRIESVIREALIRQEKQEEIKP